MTGSQQNRSRHSYFKQELDWFSFIQFKILVTTISMEGTGVLEGMSSPLRCYMAIQIKGEKPPQARLVMTRARAFSIVAPGFGLPNSLSREARLAPTLDTFWR